MANKNPEQYARDTIDAQLAASGWTVQGKKGIDFNQGAGQAIREYHTDTGPADYVLFLDKKPVGIIEAKLIDWGEKITPVEDQTAGYAAAKLKWVQDTGQPLPFLYEGTTLLARIQAQRAATENKPKTPKKKPARKKAKKE